MQLNGSNLQAVNFKVYLLQSWVLKMNKYIVIFESYRKYKNKNNNLYFNSVHYTSIFTYLTYTRAMIDIFIIKWQFFCKEAAPCQAWKKKTWKLLTTFFCLNWYHLIQVKIIQGKNKMFHWSQKGMSNIIQSQKLKIKSWI